MASDDVTESDLEKKRKRLETLRGQEADALSSAAERQAAEQRKIESAQLDAEIALTENRLSRAKEVAKVAAAKQGSAGPLAAAQAQLVAAEAQSEVSALPVDTNAEPTAEKVVTQSPPGESVTAAKTSEADKDGGNS